MSSDIGNRVAIVGGGVMGLSLAWELVKRGHAVVLIESGRLGRKASWAGAGILAPANSQTASHPLDKLMGIGSDIHRDWSTLLLQESGIDNGFAECGGLYVARSPGEKAALAGQMLYWSEYEIAHEKIGGKPGLRYGQLNLSQNDLLVDVPGESQICNPDHLKALAVACRNRGVEILENCRPEFKVRDRQVFIAGGQVPAFDQICFCTGAWTSQLLVQMGIAVPLIPVRGQMLLFKLPAPVFRPIINEGSRYIVPRQDGYVLAGSTTEEVGFDESTTDDKLAELMAFSSSLVPGLCESTLVKSWAGLRPASHDGFPFMGQLPSFENAFVATGHFKAGLQMSPAVAKVMADLMEEKPVCVNIEPFNPGRLDLPDSLKV